MVYGIFRLIALECLKPFIFEMELPRWRLTKNFRCWKTSFAG